MITESELWELYNNGLISEDTYSKELLKLKLKEKEDDKNENA